MVWLLALVVFGLIVVAARVSFSRWLEVCVVDVVDGDATFVRGTIPVGLLDEIQDVVRRPSVARARIVIRRAQGHPRVVADGLDPGQLQQLRNVVGRYPLQRILAGRVKR